MKEKSTFLKKSFKEPREVLRKYTPFERLKDQSMDGRMKPTKPQQKKQSTKS